MQNINYLKRKLIIVIVSYNRQEDIIKKIKYWSYYNFNVLILDGSPKKIKKNKLKLNKLIKYIHMPKVDYHERIFKIMHLIKYKYIKLEADDDYFLPSAIIKGLKILEKKKSISAVFGKVGLISCYQNNLYNKQLFLKNKSLLDQKFYPRLKSYFSTYSPSLYYSVMRTSVFKKNVKMWLLCKKEYQIGYKLFAEICFTMSTCFSGKIKLIDNLLWMRNDSDISKRIEFPGISKDYKFKMYKLSKSNYFDKFIENFFISDILKKEKKTFFLVKDIVKLHFEKPIKNSVFNKFFYNLIINLFKKLVPSYLKKKIRFLLKINGPSYSDICLKKVKVNYKYESKELRFVEKIYTNN